MRWEKHYYFIAEETRLKPPKAEIRQKGLAWVEDLEPIKASGEQRFRCLVGLVKIIK